ncbi:helix-turn-helix domain-containing protein [Anaerobutyricum hallii]|uniref:helix-turn-helix domain-containing protein n=1 Tax=Anaerobutyricum hallii TaxID=39488 RepID=UPI00205FF9FA|nr:helix-turn-helix transcriptional regulator [Anaerobutyricum hallii]DAM65161.1 MAG TPA: Cro/C1-type HTH DNA-binding domain protein [Caudoviricetes sp.]
MSVSYKKLWKLIIDMDISKAQLRKESGVAASTFSKMNKNEYVSLEVIERICNVLKCDIGDVVEIER